jgi:hypothetical protein
MSGYGNGRFQGQNRHCADANRATVRKLED